MCISLYYWTKSIISENSNKNRNSENYFPSMQQMFTMFGALTVGKSYDSITITKNTKIPC